MTDVFSRGWVAGVFLLALFHGVPVYGAGPLRICADARNLPFSDTTGRGFENVLAQMIASELRRPLEFVWKFRRGYLNGEELKSSFCGVVLGMPVGESKALLTTPYYRSTYVFVTRSDRKMGIRSFSDRRLRALRIGVFSGSAAVELTPPGRLAAAHGLANRLRVFRSYSRNGNESPAKALVDALERDEVDIAIGWGPAMGYFAARSKVPLTVQAVMDDPAHPAIEMSYAIAIAVPPGNRKLRAELDQFLSLRREAIRQLLIDYHVPLYGEPPRKPRKSSPFV